MSEKNNKIYEFGEFYLDAGEQIFRRDGENVTLTPKVFDLLVVLVENQGHLLTKDELIKALWAESFVEEANLNVTISALRKVLGEKPNEARFIETVPRRGYRFVAEVRKRSDEKATEEQINNENNLSEAETVSLDSPVKYCPKCQRVYYGKSLNFCLDDGEPLISGDSLNTSEFVSPKTLSDFRRKHLAFYALGGLAVILIGTLVWKFAFQSNKTEVSNVKTIAVLPFKPLTKEKTDEALEMGMADALITKLSGLEQITVRPTSAVAKFSEGNVDPIAAGKELQVEAVLDGKIQRADNKIRITVQLLRVADGATVWAGSFDDFFTNIFAVQDSISEKMTSTLALKLSNKEKEKIAKRDTENTEAYALYLQARYFHEHLSKENMLKALEFYQAAIDKDPDYARAYSSRTGAFGFLAVININREENIQKARDSVTKALSLDPNLGDAYAQLADIQSSFDWNFAEAEKNYRKAIELSPNEVDVHLSYAFFLSTLGRHDEAVRENEKAIQLNPVAPYIISHFLQVLIQARRYDDAIAQGRKAIELKLDDRVIQGQLIRAYLLKSMLAEAESLLQKFIEANPTTSDVMKATVYLHIGKKAEGEKILRERIAENKGENYSNYAMYAVRLGDREKAFEFFEKAFQNREAGITLLAVTPEYDYLRSDPRFQDLLKRIGLPMQN